MSTKSKIIIGILIATNFVSCMAYNGKDASSNQASKPVATEPANKTETSVQPQPEEDLFGEPDWNKVIPVTGLKIKNKSGKYTYIVGKMTNNSGKALSYLEVNVSVYGSNNELIDTEYTNETEVRPGEVVAFELMSDSSGVSSAKVDSVKATIE